MADTQLLPCPWCGETPDVSNDASFRLTDGVKYGALQCCVVGPEVRTDYKDVPHWRDRAIAAWNDRKALASRPAEVDDEGLPPLPQGVAVMTEFPRDQAASRHYTPYRPGWLGSFPPTGSMLYTAEQFRQGQRDAVAADRARMPAADEISDAITEAFNLAFTNRDWEARDHWRDVGNRFSQWAAPSHTTNKEK